MFNEKESASRQLKGIPAAPGMAFGKAFILRREKLVIPERRAEKPEEELERLQTARKQAREEIQKLQERMQQEVGEEEAALFDAHAMFLDDPSLLEIAEAAIQSGRTAEAGWTQAAELFAYEMEQIPDETLRERAADIRDVEQRVLSHLLGKGGQGPLRLDQPSVILAEDLVPSETASLDRRMVLGFCTALGGPTSHTAILAKALDLPAVVGLGAEILNVPPGAPLIIDGNLGILSVYPGKEETLAFETAQREAEARSKSELSRAHEPAVTRDGKAVEVVANIGAVPDAEAALKMGAEGIGLLRTEFLYLEREVAPSEEEQFEAYSAILGIMGKRPVVVRTLDIGGDKPLPYLHLEPEPNPFLGWRAIRFLLEEPELFKPQLRALLRASPGHDLRIMFPMIATLEDIRRIKALIDEVRQELEKERIRVSESLQVGIMVEIPSVAVLADLFAREVDFFSIGTNDLTQYTLAADRMNPKVAHYGDSLHPAVLRLISQVIEVGHSANIWVGVCGELAGEPLAIPILLGMGLDEFSMAPASIPRAKAILRRWSAAEARKLAEEALSLDTAPAIRKLVSDREPAQPS